MSARSIANLALAIHISVILVDRLVYDVASTLVLADILVNSSRPYVSIKNLKHKRIKISHLSYLPALMVSSKNRNPISITNFQCHKKRHSLHRIVTSICTNPTITHSATDHLNHTSVSSSFNFKTNQPQ